MGGGGVGLVVTARFGDAPPSPPCPHSKSQAAAPLVVFRQTLHQQVAAKIEKGEPVTPPGVPKHYPDAKKLVTEDCIRPGKL